MSPAIEIRDLFRVHSTPEGDAAALQGLSLTVRDREVVSVLGPSGSGKSTLLRILAGLDRPSAGSVRVFGLELRKLSGRGLSAYRSSTVGYADQHYNRALAPELSARELVALELSLRGAARRERVARADELLERVGLLARRDAHPMELSGGEQQRVAVCAAIAHRPRLLLADEPTGELDARSAELIYDAIGALARDEGCTTVIVSHDPQSATIADRIVHIRDGRVSEETAREDGGGRIVVGRGGWLRLPEEYLRRAGIGARAVATVEEGGVLVSPGEPAEEVTPDAPVPGRRRRPAATGVVAELRGVTKTFGTGATATSPLADVDAAFEAGLLHAVTGPSGSGKTTLLHLLAGLELPTAGDVVVSGTRVSSLDRAARARLRRERIAVVGQQVGLVPFLSARENVELALALRGVAGDEASRGALEALDTVGLGERAEQRVARLSTGERGRVAIARAVATRPALLLADEPTSRLDHANALAVGALFGALAREWGTAIVCATHDPAVIEQADDELPLRHAVPLAREPV